MSIVLGDKKLLYIAEELKYILTFISAKNDGNLKIYINKIFESIFPLYDEDKLRYNNVCGANAEYLCKNLKIDNCKFGRLLIVNWLERNQAIFESIERIYGPIVNTIGASYHCLVYVEIKIDSKIYYGAIETVICRPYKLQFYVSNTIEELTTIINTRYQCKDFVITFDCDKNWWEFFYPMSGGTRTHRYTPKRRYTHKHTRTHTRTQTRTQTRTHTHKYNLKKNLNKNNIK